MNAVQRRCRIIDLFHNLCRTLETADCRRQTAAESTANSSLLPSAVCRLPSFPGKYRLRNMSNEKRESDAVILRCFLFFGKKVVPFSPPKFFAYPERKELFQKKGLTTPQCSDESVDTADSLKNDGQECYTTQQHSSATTRSGDPFGCAPPGVPGALRSAECHVYPNGFAGTNIRHVPVEWYDSLLAGSANDCRWCFSAQYKSNYQFSVQYRASRRFSARTVSTPQCLGLFCRSSKPNYSEYFFQDLWVTGRHKRF